VSACAAGLTAGRKLLGRDTAERTSAKPRTRNVLLATYRACRSRRRVICRRARRTALVAKPRAALGNVTEQPNSTRAAAGPRANVTRESRTRGCSRPRTLRVVKPVVTSRADGDQRVESEALRGWSDARVLDCSCGARKDSVSEQYGPVAPTAEQRTQTARVRLARSPLSDIRGYSSAAWRKSSKRTVFYLAKTTSTLCE
jgi:hypothetical protein